MKKRKLLLWIILFWSMIFPSLSFNEFTTDLTTDNISYSDLWNSSRRIEIMQKAEWDWWFW